MNDRTGDGDVDGDEKSPFGQVLDAMAVKPGTWDARMTSVVFTLIVGVLTLTLALSAFHAIWAHHLWTGILESAAALALCLVTLVIAVIAALEWTSWRGTWTDERR